MSVYHGEDGMDLEELLRSLPPSVGISIERHPSKTPGESDDWRFGIITEGHHHGITTRHPKLREAVRQGVKAFRTLTQG